MTEDKKPDVYTRDEADEILVQAIQRQHEEEEGIAHDDLVEAAKEVGVSPARVEAAARAVGRKSAEAKRREAEHDAAKSKLARSALVYVVVNTFLFFVNRETRGHWFYWALLGWGLGLALQAVKVFFPRTKAEVAEKSRGDRRARREARQGEGARLRVEGELKPQLRVGPPDAAAPSPPLEEALDDDENEESRRAKRA